MRAEEINETVVVFRSQLWGNNSVLLRSRDRAALVFDPSLTPIEIEEIRATAYEINTTSVHVLVTHSHIDHICGTGYFPAAEVIMGAETANLVENGAVAARLAEASTEWGFKWLPVRRATRTAYPGDNLSCGSVRVTIVRADGNAVDGVAYVLQEEGVMVCGDFLSAALYPFIDGDPRAARASCERLVDALALYGVEHVVSGHGVVLTAAQAVEIADADIRYLALLEDAVREAAVSGLSPGEALVAVYAVEPPRAIQASFEIFAPRLTNARRVLEVTPA